MDRNELWKLISPNGDAYLAIPEKSFDQLLLRKKEGPVLNTEIGVGQQIRILRVSKGLTQKDLAVAASVKQVQVSRIEKGLTKKPRDIKLIDRLFAILHVRNDAGSKPE